MDEYRILDVPGLGPMLLDDNARFGYKELFRPSKPVTYISNSSGFSFPVEEGTEIAMERSLEHTGDLWGAFGGGIAGYGAAVGAGASGLAGAGMLSGMYAGGKTRELGKRRARRHIRKAMKTGGVADLKPDLSSLEKIIDKMDLMGKVDEYDRKIEMRKQAQKKKGWFSRNFYMDEDDEIRKYRTCEIAAIFDALKNECENLPDGISEPLQAIYGKAAKSLSEEYGSFDTQCLMRTYLEKRFGG